MLCSGLVARREILKGLSLIFFLGISFKGCRLLKVFETYDSEEKESLGSTL